ncbi:hypothetical protein G4B88_002822 [Cannabis sativa]|uniref:Uncharacterized protein n=1 Tax=Cannabis sativa TaxID=3483 RepID=A0A7J6EEW7_CANSA|nr:hypothetical protein G4B88_002822 [Cannabis sativa]
MESTTASLNAGDLKVTAIAAGEAHTLALTGVHSWGRGMFGRLGRGSETDEISPAEVRFEYPQQQQQQQQDSDEKSIKIVAIAAGAYHSLALADDGSIWSWGYNLYNSTVPCLVKQFLKSETTTTNSSLKICSIKAGGMTSLAIDNIGGLWIWGNYPQQSTEGGLSFVSTFAPSPVKDLLGYTVMKVACGTEHIVALVSTEKILCYSWGGNKHGQLGLGDTQSRHCPEIVETFNQDSPWEIYEVACGSLHTALLARKKAPPPSDTHESTCWTFGLGENGQLGHGTTKNAMSPQQVNGLPDSVSLISVDCGLFHTSVLSSSGEAWSWGMERGLGLCPSARVSAVSGDAVSPLLISCSEQNAKFDKPVQVACGAAHTVLVTKDGYEMWSWGRGRSGVLGNGKTDDCLTPTRVLWPEVTEDDKQVETKTDDSEETKTEEKDSKQDENLEKMKVLESRLSAMEQYASILHGSIFGKPFEEKDIPMSLQNSGTFDVAKEWETMLESADRGRLVGLEMFYRNMLSGVKDKLMKKRIQEVMKECLNPFSSK